MTLRDILKVLKYSYPRQEFTAENVKAYSLLLRDLDLGLLELAVLQLIRESTFFPTIAEITGRVADLSLQKSGHVSAIEAYEIAMKGGRLREDYPDVLRAVEMSCGGTYNLRHGDNPAADRARFIEAYNVITEQKRAEVVNFPAVKVFLEAGNGNGYAQLNGGSYVSENGR